jgi:hypothetical protein
MDLPRRAGYVQIRLSDIYIPFDRFVVNGGVKEMF